jgi:rSAM/selenodomain-associated transferase 2/rSAM/selenodomain-associated transferase 1
MAAVDAGSRHPLSPGPGHPERGRNPAGELAVIIPTLDEEEFLPRLLSDLGDLPQPSRVVVVDGGSADRTPEVAAGAGATVLHTPPGRARQLNAGAASVSSPWLLFLHADSRLPPGTRTALGRWLEKPSLEGAAHFRFRLDARGPGWTFIEWGQRLRERLTGLVYGDQGLLISRRRWEAMGGIPEIPVMEDVETVRRLRRNGGLDRIDAPLVTSRRRYEEVGVVRGLVRNASLITLYRLGVSADRLARWYPPRRGKKSASISEPRRDPAVREAPGSGPPELDSSAPTPILLVFAKAPRPGRVKTRLAATVGPHRAARIYRDMGKRVVDRLRGGSFRVRICFAPADARPEMEDWLGSQGMEFQPQSGRELGERMRSAFKEAFEETDRVCIVGTDVPALHRGLVERALDELNEVDAVFGPALDGGYYLLALRRPAPELFHGIPWSTPSVLQRSLERAGALGLQVALLPALADVDREEDLPPELAAAPPTEGGERRLRREGDPRCPEVVRPHPRTVSE